MQLKTKMLKEVSLKIYGSWGIESIRHQKQKAKTKRDVQKTIIKVKRTQMHKERNYLCNSISK